jgi:PEP-CTERM motif
MRTLTSLVARSAASKTFKGGTKARFIRAQKMEGVSQQKRIMAFGVLSAAILSLAKPALAQTATLFTTQDDFATWTNPGGNVVSVAPSGVYDADGITINAVGNTTNYGGTGTAGSLQINTGSNGMGFNALATSPNEQNNQSFMSVIDPGSAGGATVAFSGTLFMTYTVPAFTGPNDFNQLGFNIAYPGDGFFHTFFETSLSPVTTVDGFSTVTATIPYTISAGAAGAFSIQAYINAGVFGAGVNGVDNVINGPFYIDNIAATGTAPPPPPKFTSETANWVHNGNSTWETAANWNPNSAIPGGNGSIITFDNNGGAITANPTVSLSNGVQAALLTFGNTSGIGTPVNYTIANGAAGASIVVGSEIDADSGTHAINVPVSTTNGNFFFGMNVGASLSIPTFSDSSFGTVTVTSPLTGGTVGGSLSLGTTSAFNLNDNGTAITFLPGSGGFIFGLNVNTGSTVNLGANTWNTNSLGGDTTGTIVVPTGGTLFTAEFLGAAANTTFYNGTFSGGGSIVIGEGATSTTTTAQIFGNSAVFTGNNSAFSGTITAGSSFPAGNTFMTAPAAFTIEIGAANNLGDGSATNMVILDGGIFQSIGSFNATQNVIVTANGGTIDTDGPLGGNPANGPVPGGTAIALGAISSTATGAALTKINSGQLTVTSIRGVALSIGNVQSGTPTSGGTVVIASNNDTVAGAQAGVSVLTSLTIQTDSSGNYLSTLDLKNNSLIIKGAGSAGAATVQAEIAVGRNNNPTGGAWTGTGITSSTAAASATTTALGMELNDNGSGQPLLTTFEGQTVADGDVLVKYTFVGDADLSGHINATDYMLIDAGFASGGTKTGWRNGDFNYDGVINGDDYTLIDNAFNTQGSVTFAATSAGPAEQVASPAAVPEPATLSLIGLGTAGLMMRRRRRI